MTPLIFKKIKLTTNYSLTNYTHTHTHTYIYICVCVCVCVCVWKKIMDSNPTICEEKLTTSNPHRKGHL